MDWEERRNRRKRKSRSRKMEGVLLAGIQPKTSRGLAGAFFTSSPEV
jgi:hypothetical protein